MKCANCGNTNTKSLFMEGDTFYCSKCANRTYVKTGKIALVRCRFCKNMKPVKSMYCNWCGSSDRDYGRLSRKDRLLIMKYKQGI